MKTPPGERDYTKRFACPECGAGLHGHKADYANGNVDGVEWLSQRAIGELFFDRETRLRFYPHGSSHKGNRIKTYVEGTLGELVPLRPPGPRHKGFDGIQPICYIDPPTVIT